MFPQYIAVNPSIKLRWYTQYAPEKARDAKDLFIREVSAGNFLITVTDLLIIATCVSHHNDEYTCATKLKPSISTFL